ncbi:MAG: phosphotransferase [Bacteroidota bacterium]
MTIFPTQYSLLSAQALGEYIRKQYGFEEVQCSLLIHNVGDTYLVVLQDLKFVFKVYRDAHRSLEEIKGELELLHLLGQGGAKVALPVADLQNELIKVFQAAEGVRHGVLFSYAQGEVVPLMNDQQLEVLGKEMAKVHSLSAVIKLSFKRKEFSIDTMLTGPLERIKPAFKGLEPEYEYLTATARLVQDRIAGLALESFGYGYCHYDFLPKNFHFNDRNEITFFDFAGQGYFVIDLASLYAHYFLLVSQQKISQQEA